MNAVTCKYHTQTPAQWHCQYCQISYCPSCVTQLHAHRAPECPICKRELDSLGAANLIKPFWLRLRQFFIYSAHPAPLVLLLVLSLLVFLLRLVPGWEYDYNILFWTFPRNALLLMPIMIVFLKYAHSVMEDTAHGHLQPSPLSSDKLFENGLIVVKLLAVFLAFYLLEWAALDLLNMPGYYLAVIITALATPAAIMVLVMEDDLTHALNPAILASVVRRIGTPYFIMFVLFYLLTIAKSTLLAILNTYIDPSLSFAVYSFFTMYFYLMMFNMMGYILYQYHEVLGYSVEIAAHEQEQSQLEEVITASPELRAIEILLHEGKHDQAIKQLQLLIKANPSDIEARERMLKLVRLTGHELIHTEQAQECISYLIGENKMAHAARIFESAYEFDKQFRPAKAVERLEMAKYLRQNNQGKLAMAILDNLHRDFPSFERVPEAYLIVAQLLAEKFNDDERAMQVLEFVIKNYPAHPLHNEVEEYLKIIRASTN